MKIIEGLEDWNEMRQYKLEDCLTKWTGIKPGMKRTLIISRSGYGHKRRGLNYPTKASWDSPLYMSGRHIPKLELRRPRDIDPESDGNYQLLVARRLVISREAFFDLTAKWIWRK